LPYVKDGDLTAVQNVQICKTTIFQFYRVHTKPPTLWGGEKL